MASPVQRHPNYVVLIGDVGQGKSTIVEKIAGVSGLKSIENFSATKFATPFFSQDQSLLICDTPGANPMKDKLDHNMNIAYALNTYPVSLILIVVKADIGRIDSAIEAIGKYAESFSSLFENLGVCVTHMDKVQWSPEMFKENLSEQFGLEEVVFTGIRTSGNQLTRDIRGICSTAQVLNITCENFLKYFKVSNNNIKVMRSVKREVGNFKVMKNDFEASLPSFSEKEQVDLVFEFQAWMTEQITQAQMRVSEENNFQFISGSNIANEAGHLANMTNQLKLVLYDIRLRAQGYQSNHGITSLRKCPHCGYVWAKLEGCDGQTTCGSRMSSVLDGRYNNLATFAFSWLSGKLRITKHGDKQVQQKWGAAGKSKGAGCGRNITWSQMAPVPVPAELACLATVDVEDIHELPQPVEITFNEEFGRRFEKLSLKLSQKF